jgi:hypothetical protein
VLEVLEVGSAMLARFECLNGLTALDASKVEARMLCSGSVIS